MRLTARVTCKRFFLVDSPSVKRIENFLLTQQFGRVEWYPQQIPTPLESGGRTIPHPLPRHITPRHKINYSRPNYAGHMNETVKSEGDGGAGACYVAITLRLGSVFLWSLVSSLQRGLNINYSFFCLRFGHIMSSAGVGEILRFSAAEALLVLGRVGGGGLFVGRSRSYCRCFCNT